MLSGEVNSESLFQTLRSAGQKRKSGVLQVQLLDRQLSIIFVQGRIVEVLDSLSDSIDEVCTRLKEAGLLPDHYEASANSYSSLAEVLCDARIHLVDERGFKRAVKHRILEKLYTMLADDMSGSFFFLPRVPDLDSALPAISVSQLLLDFTALAATRARYQDLFGGAKSVVQVAPAPDSIGEDEAAILEVLPRLNTPHEIYKRSLLSSYGFENAVLTLFEMGVIDVQEYNLCGIKQTDGEGEQELTAAPNGEPAAAVEDPAVLTRPPDTAPRVGSRSAQHGVSAFPWEKAVTVLYVLVLILALSAPVLFWEPIFRWFLVDGGS